jgi:hypothetical protein
MGKVVKGIGKVVSAPARGIGHALRTSHIPGLSNIGGAVENVGNAFAGKGAFLRDIGKAGEAAAPIAGLIPGVGPLAGLALGAGGGLLNRGLNARGLGEAAKFGGEGALSGFAGKELLGGKGIMGLGNLPGGLSNLGHDISGFAGKIGRALPIGVHGGAPLDLGKLATGAMGASNFLGAQQQRKQAQAYNNAEIDQRNKLMQAILGGSNFNPMSGGAPAPMPYNPRGPNLNQQSSATSGGY